MAESGGFEAVDDFAGAAPGDDEFVGDVVDAAGSAAAEDLEGFESAEGDAGFVAEAAVEGVPQLRLVADEVVEQAEQVGHASL